MAAAAAHDDDDDDDRHHDNTTRNDKDGEALAKTPNLRVVCRLFCLVAPLPPLS
jgi:hypothetical protein